MSGRRTVDGLKQTATLSRLLEALLKDLPDMNLWELSRSVGAPAVRVTSLIDKLEDRRWITGEWETGVPEGVARRRFYRLTPIGRTHALMLLRRYDDLP
ncbi:hypothetical protein [Nonomuraea sp. NPDC023979]|uniref:hypothetical protein n=1 Tax=Nonomuraea sp. NPDC023979 TaxID=3154796 RepID=UPI0033E7BF84